MGIQIKNMHSSFWEKCLILVCFFNSFFMSICNRLQNGVIIALIISIIVVVGYALSNGVRLYKRDFTVFCIIQFVCVLNCFYFDVEFSEYVCIFLFCYIPMILVGGVVDLNKNSTYIYMVSCIYVVFLLFYMVAGYTRVSTVHSDYIDYLGFAYYAIPSLLFIIEYYFRTKSKSSLIFIVLGVFYLAICGTRGPVLCTFVYFIYCVLNEWNNGSMKKKMTMLMLCSGVFLVLMNAKTIVLFLYPIFEQNGFSTRFFLFFMKKLDIADLSGRDTLSNIVIQNIDKHFFLGSGIMGDRVLFGGKDQGYCHNLILEVLNSFGVPLGVILLVLLFGLVIISFRKTKSRIIKEFIVIYTTASVVKLFISSSFMQESSLFILIGICFAGLRTAKDDLEVVDGDSSSNNGIRWCGRRI